MKPFRLYLAETKRKLEMPSHEVIDITRKLWFWFRGDYMQPEGSGEAVEALPAFQKLKKALPYRPKAMTLWRCHILYDWEKYPDVGVGENYHFPKGRKPLRSWTETREKAVEFYEQIRRGLIPRKYTKNPAYHPDYTDELKVYLISKTFEPKDILFGYDAIPKYHDWVRDYIGKYVTRGFQDQWNLTMFLHQKEYVVYQPTSFTAMVHDDLTPSPEPSTSPFYQR